MSDYRVLVTGSRDYGNRDTILYALVRVKREHPGVSPVLVHGMCDPRHPRTGHAIRWAAAQHLAEERQYELLGADWLATVIAARLGWDTEPHPADWQQHNKGAGFRRNEFMVRLGADLCLGFPAPCVAPRCNGQPEHDSHGTAHCMRLAKEAGIDVRRFTPAP